MACFTPKNNTYCSPNVNAFLDTTNRLTTNFVWNNKKPKIKRDTLIGPKDRRGLDLPEFEIISKSLQTAWVKRMKNGVEDQWMSIPLFYLRNVGGPFIFDFDYDVKFLGLNNIPAFYTDVLNAWPEVREQTSDNEIFQSFVLPKFCHITRHFLACTGCQ